MMNSHADPDFCREMGERVVTVTVTKNMLLRSNGPQGNPYANNQRAQWLRRLGCVEAVNHMNRGLAQPVEGRVDLLCVIAYPKHANRADPPNMWPTCKHLIDGFTDAGLWADDDSMHIRRTGFQRDPAPTARKGMWRIDFHIIPVEEES